MRIARKLDLRGEGGFTLERHVVTDADCWDLRHCNQRTDPVHLAHMTNFLDAVRSRRTQDLAASAEIGHASAAMCHFGNISMRVGFPATQNEIASALGAMPAAAAVAKSMGDRLAVHSVDLAKRPLTLGTWMDIEANGDGIARVSSGVEGALERARYFLQETPRPPYVIPETV